MIFLIRYKLYTSEIIAKNYRTSSYIIININYSLIYMHQHNKNRENINIFHMHGDEQYMLESDSKTEKKKYYVDVFQLSDVYGKYLDVCFPDREYNCLFSIIYQLSIGTKNKNFTILNIIKNVSRNQLKKIIGAYRKIINKTRNVEQYQKTRIYVKGKFQVELII